MQNLYRLANIVGLDTKNAQHSVALTEAMHGIDDQEAFLDYCRDNKEGITTYGIHEKPERLDTLSKRYKKMQDEAGLPHDDAELSSSRLSVLFGNARLFLKNEIEQGRHPDLRRMTLGGDPYFTDAQADALETIGSLPYLIELSETNELKSELIGLFLSRYLKKSRYASLTAGSKKVMRLIGNIK